MRNLLNNNLPYLNRLFFIGLLFPFGVFSQFANSDWDTIPFPYGTQGVGIEFIIPDPSNTSLVIGGGGLSGSNPSGNYLLKYENNTVQPLGEFDNKIWGATYYHGELIVGGGFENVSGVPVTSLAKYNGQNWSPFGEFIFDSLNQGLVRDVLVIDDTLYAVGGFNVIDGDSIKAVARLINGNWEAVYGSPLYGIASYILKYKGNLYVSGVNVMYNGTIYSDIAMYKNGEWQPVGPPYLGGGFTHIKDMTVYNDELYVLGWIQKNDGNVGNGIQKWDGTQWSEVGTGLQSVNPGYGTVQPFDMEVHNGKLYVVGGFIYAGNVPARFVATWDGNQWCSMNTSVFSASSPTFFNGVGFLNDSIFCGFSGRITEGNDSAFYQGVVKAPLNLISDTCSIDFTTGITDLNLSSSDLVISPNPASSFINIKFDRLPESKVRVWITDYSGRVVKQQRVYESINEIPVSIKGFSNGLYFVHIEIDNAVQVKKLVVAH